MPPKIARLAGLGAYAVCAGLVALYLLFVFITLPTASAGLDGTSRFLSLFTVAGAILAVIAVHVVVAPQLLTVARGESRPV